ncbi:kinase-like protein [Xylona heveae TC161]|uniref:non-specific serine/threonine protein kinase n=1 Tax=Xylona heveae (strain CBS 132557 / TC161) TaxID=1328760 RepID=A0A165FDW5_XYLHT|nr:kinase-like protein [Xylona heveae TC161]KZF20865.1 kinase-like protein [Xylona heveae TC161]
MGDSDQYEILEKIGHGSFGIIRKVKRKTDGYVLCRKEISYTRMSQKEREQLHAEFSILSSLRHPNIVAYYHREHLKSSQDLHLYMEYCGNGDLGRVIKTLKANNQFAEEPFVWSIFTQLVTALYRCHYGIDPPEVAKNVLGPSSSKPTALKSKAGQIMILHRDLKPENVFLGENNSVKLGDFGLSKILASHDFASTYVGTPFYMSPEICAAERYTLHSDLWSLGCIIYELCAREPPFNAKTHFDLVQKIKIGKIESLPPIYSKELQSVIRDCLQVNPLRRPDTWQLLDLPMVKIIRKEREIVDLGKILKTKEESAGQKLKEAEDRVARLQQDQDQFKADIEASLRREWEVRARLEIDRQVQLELERLRKAFGQEVSERVESELSARLQAMTQTSNDATNTAAEVLPESIPQSSVSTNSDVDFPSMTDLSELSLESPNASKSDANKKSNSRTPFSRSRTMFVGSPADVAMADPSPISIASLSLSPRRTTGNGKGRNIFAAAAEKKWEPMTYSDDEDDDDEDDEVPALNSPVAHKSQGRNDPFKVPSSGASRPAMLRQKTAPMRNIGAPQPSLFAKTLSDSPSRQSVYGGEKSIPLSPSRRQTKISAPTGAGRVNGSGSPISHRVQQGKLKSGIPSAVGSKPSGHGGEEMRKAAMHRNMGGRTLVELAQARAGGRSAEEAIANGEKKANRPTTLSGPGLDVKYATKMADKDKEVAVWDPERDDMPSPFLKRGVRQSAFGAAALRKA